MSVSFFKFSVLTRTSYLTVILHTSLQLEIFPTYSATPFALSALVLCLG
ncbi:MAG: hypothetical protein QW815_05800 [Nitrososphaerota archaeon]